MWQSALSRYARAGLVGFSGGACVGLVGWGGAQFIIPGMTMMGHSQLAATGISLCYLSLSAVTGAAKFVASDNACLATAAAMALPSVITARIGTRMAARIPRSDAAAGLQRRQLAAHTDALSCAAQCGEAGCSSRGRRRHGLPCHRRSRADGLPNYSSETGVALCC